MRSVSLNFCCPFCAFLSVPTQMLLWFAQMIDRVCVKVQDHLNSLRSCGGDAIQEDLKAAEQLMRDAKNSKTVSLSLEFVRSCVVFVWFVPVPISSNCK